MMLSRKRRTKKKQQQRINSSLKKRLYKNVFMAPCCYCNRVFLIDKLTIEHIVPLSRGGTNEDSNIALACAPCNQEKGRIAWFQNKEIKKHEYKVQHSA